MRDKIRDRIFKDREESEIHPSILINGDVLLGEEDDLSPDEIKEICETIVKDVPNVKYLSFLSSNLNDQCCDIIYHQLKNLKQLSYLNMEGNNYGEKGLISLYLLNFHLESINPSFRLRPRSAKIGGNVSRYLEIEKKARKIFESMESN